MRRRSTFKKPPHLLQTGDYYRLTSPFQEGPYTAWAHVSPDGREASSTSHGPSKSAMGSLPGRGGFRTPGWRLTAPELPPGGGGLNQGVQKEAQLTNQVEGGALRVVRDVEHGVLHF